MKLLQIGIQPVLAAEVAAAPGQVADDERLRPGAGGFVVLMIDAVVADEGIAHHNALSGVGGVGQDLLIAGHGGVEHHLADPLLTGADAAAREGHTVFPDQSRFHLLHHAFRSQVICTIVTENLPPDNTLCARKQKPWIWTKRAYCRFSHGNTPQKLKIRF